MIVEQPQRSYFSKNSSAFLNYKFFEILVSSGVVNAESGWQQKFIHNNNETLYFYEKNHSYGEYIFDWAWADSYARCKKSYYPKLLSMIPFTPVTTSHFISENISQSCIDEFEEYYRAGDFSSAHFLFLTEVERDFFKRNHYMLRESFQYHFFNQEYKSFEDFLEKLKSRKAKQIRKERLFDQDMVIKTNTENDLKPAMAQEMYNFYLNTIYWKNAIPYLNLDFFQQCFEKLKNNVVYIQAFKQEELVAGSLFFYDDETLYGRYWGQNKRVKNLHFELCYYRGIDYCIEKKLKKFEAGAQGEHKIARGFTPMRTHSAHKVKDTQFSVAIENFIMEESQAIDRAIQYLSQYSPYTK